MFLRFLFRLVDLLFAGGMAGSVLVLILTMVEDARTVFRSIIKMPN